MKIVIKLSYIFNSTLVLGLIFILLGDKFLPQPLSTASANTRNSIQTTVIKFMKNERQEYKSLKGGEAKTPVKFRKMGTYFDDRVQEAEKQINVNNSN
ncbi:hypothetical protein [Aphanothece sacrum]|uniref:Chloroplast carboxyltransferase alpha subunit n=1 Tax=Aphanothece sacrum FPU1 TaxID=1920663 RepID=A0A401IJ20_APHSA|nr:hypothetical protein [Aphanothece sacrum]GBF81101.1 chloroplast carboxyltransferase alpha subunit [Aphanothece sacrum FPU1]GBF85502.1 carboxyltransferase alpha subunit [Aphanothece sacrum FPU3]